MKKIHIVAVLTLCAMFVSSHLQAQQFWQSAGLKDSSITSLVCNANGVLIAAVNGRSLYRSTDGGGTWASIPPPPIYITFTAIDDQGLIYVGDLDAKGLQRTTDNGVHWTDIADTMSIGCYSLGLSPGGEVFATFQDGMGTIFHKLFRSTNHGDSWRVDSVSFTPAVIANITSQSVYTFAPNGDSYVISTDGLYRSTDGGTNWTRSMGALPPYQVRSFLSTSQGHLFFPTNGTGKGVCVFRSTDGAASWTACDTVGLPAFASFNQLTVDKNNVLYGIVYGTLADGIYRSADEGHTWSNVSSGISPVGLLNVIVPSPTGTLYCATQFGVYKSTGQLTAVRPSAQQPVGFVLEQNYPNPFNPTTRIAYVIPSGAGSGLPVEGSGKGNQSSGLSAYRLRLTVHDLLGREVAVLVDEVQAPGRHEVTFDARGLASGMYMYRLQSGSLVETKRMVLVR
jgi:photosystem II stability/assembly factor-like uncharacterized protein